MHFESKDESEMHMVLQHPFFDAKSLNDATLQNRTLGEGPVMCGRSSGSGKTAPPPLPALHPEGGGL